MTKWVPVTIIGVIWLTSTITLAPAQEAAVAPNVNIDYIIDVGTCPITQADDEAVSIRACVLFTNKEGVRYLGVLDGNEVVETIKVTKGMQTTVGAK